MISKNYATYKALKLLESQKPERPSEFAQLMWPNSPRWSRRVRCGKNGVSVGGGMNLAGGAFLGKLKKDMLISYYYPRDSYSTNYLLTEEGKQFVKDFESNSDILFDTSAYPSINRILEGLSDCFLMSTGDAAQLVIFANSKQIPCSPLLSTHELDDFCRIYQDHYLTISCAYNDWIARSKSLLKFPELWLFDNIPQSLIFIKNGSISALIALVDTIKILLEQNDSLSLDELIVFTSKGLTYSVIPYKHDDFFVVSVQDKYILAIFNQVERYEVACISFATDDESEVMLFSSDSYRNTKRELRLLNSKSLKRG